MRGVPMADQSSTAFDALRLNATKARTVLGWHQKVSFRELVEMMVDADVKALQPTSASDLR